MRFEFFPMVREGELNLAKPQIYPAFAFRKRWIGA